MCCGEYGAKPDAAGLYAGECEDIRRGVVVGEVGLYIGETELYCGGIGVKPGDVGLY